MKTKFSEYLTALRRKSGYTQAQIAQRLGISRSSYANYENGNRSPNFEVLEQIADVLDCSLDELFGRHRGFSGNPAGLLMEDPVSYGRRAQKQPGKMERRLAVGAQDFRFIREKNTYYVDKTQMIGEFLESWYQVTLITRPRRFGKTLNLSMLAEFLDGTKDSAALFEGLKISRSSWMCELNRHPVVALSFLNVKADSAEGMLRQLSGTLLGEYRRYLPVVDGSGLPGERSAQFYHIYQILRRAEDSEELRSCLKDSVSVLCQMLEDIYQKKVYLFLDEYDTPFLSASEKGYYDAVRDVLSGLMSAALKGNPSLEKALLTGIQRVAKENIFSGLNHLMVCTVRDSEYGDCFGFTEDEVRALLEYCGVSFTDEVRAMYDGYQIGGAELYNPWSISCYAARRKLEPYWVNTSENGILKHALSQRGTSFAASYRRLIEQKYADVVAELSTAYYEEANDASLWGLLVNAGMLTIEEQLGEDFYRLRVPDREVWTAFRELTAFSLQVEESDLRMMLQDLQRGDMESFAEAYQRILLELPSCYDLKSENSYHMMMLGICAFLEKDYIVKSNRESGQGRGDILLYAKKPGDANIVLEFKYTKDTSQDLGELAGEAVNQIREKKYDAEMKGAVRYVGLAHCGKQAEIRWDFP